MREPPSGVFVGLTTLDVVHRVAAPPAPNRKVTATRQDVASGGPAANAAVMFAGLGGRSRLVTMLGPSAPAQLARADLERHGVEVIDVADPADKSAPELPVSAIAVSESSGERTIVSVDATAAPRPDRELLRQAVASVADADVLLLDGHHPVLAATALAARAGHLAVLDAGRWKDRMADMLTPSVEVVASADFRAPGADTTAATATELLRTGSPFVAVTDGPNSIRWWTADATGSVDVPTVAAVDTLGAGDAFHGAYAFARGRGDDAVEALGFAAEAAAVRCSHVGPRSWLPFLPSPVEPANLPTTRDPLAR